MAVDQRQDDHFPATPPTPERLLNDFEAFEEALDAARTIAVTGSPYGGRDSLLAHAADYLDTDHVRLGPSEPTTVRSELDGTPLVVDNCQQLYSREIGGFDVFREDLTALTRSDQAVVTGWNSVAWTYLDRIEAVSDVFDEVIPVRQLPPDELETYVRDRREIPTIEGDNLGDSIVSAEQFSTGWGQFSLPKFDLGVLNDQVWPTPEPTEAFFGRLCSLSRGNPGVALAIFDQLDEGVVSPSDLTTLSIEFDDTGDFLLRLLLAGECVDSESLAERVGERYDRLIGRLTRAGIAAQNGEAVVLTPLGVPTAVDRTERRRML